MICKKLQIDWYVHYYEVSLKLILCGSARKSGYMENHLTLVMPWIWGVQIFFSDTHQIQVLLSSLFLFRSIFQISKQYRDRCPCHV
jgi:hypothetical protein